MCEQFIKTCSECVVTQANKKIIRHLTPNYPKGLQSVHVCYQFYFDLEKLPAIKLPLRDQAAQAKMSNQ